MKMLEAYCGKCDSTYLYPEDMSILDCPCPDCSTEGRPEPEETPKLMEDPFLKFWEEHQVHRAGFEPAVVEQFREFAVEVWNAARYEIAARHADLLLCVKADVPGETRHETARRYIEEGDAKTLAERERHARLAGQ